MRPPLQYFGSKWRVVDWILGLLPRHICYVEPFGGSAAVLLSKAQAPHDVYNDIDGAVVSFFRVLRDRPLELVRAIDLTPYSRAEHALSFEACDDEMEAARRLYVRSWQTRGGLTRHAAKNSWRYCVTSEPWSAPPVRWKRHLEGLFAVADRLSGCYIESADWREVLRRFDAPGTLFYLDPPYLLASRSRTSATYQHELSDADHAELLEVARGLSGMVAISGYASPLYDEALAGWSSFSMTSRTQSNRQAVEKLWLSPAAAAARAELPLFRRGTQEDEVQDG